MKVIILILNIFLFLWANTSVIAKDFNNLKPFIGIEIARQSHRISSMLDFGNEMTNTWPAKKPFLHNIFTGIKFNENLGLEIGYEKQKAVYSYDKTTYQNNNNFHVTRDSRQKAKYPYIGLICESDINRRTKYQAFLGVSASTIKILKLTKIKYSNIYMGVNRVDGSADITLYARKVSLAPMLRVSVIHYITDKLAMRISLKYRKGFKMTYSSTADMRQSPLLLGIDSNGKIKIKDTFNIGLGIIYYL